MHVFTTRPMNMEKRREFLKNLAGLTAGVMLPKSNLTGFPDNNRDRLGELLPTRKLGKTGVNVSMLGVGGYHVGWTTERKAQEVIEVALEGGIRFFDSAESYGPHTSEIRLGKYLTPKYRDLIFLMTKSYSKDGKTASRHLEESLVRLNTDYLDLWQIHSVRDPKDVDDRIENGILDAALEAQQSGKAKFIGFTGHQNPAAHLRMLERTADNPIFQTIQMPINVLDFSHQSFIQQVLPVAVENEIGVLAMKTLADGRFFPGKTEGGKEVWNTDDAVVPGRITVQEALHFVWSLPISVLITGAENSDLMKEKIRLAKSFSALDQKAREDLAIKVEDLAQEGKVEYYKKV